MMSEPSSISRVDLLVLPPRPPLALPALVALVGVLLPLLGGVPAGPADAPAACIVFSRDSLMGDRLLLPDILGRPSEDSACDPFAVNDWLPGLPPVLLLVALLALGKLPSPANSAIRLTFSGLLGLGVEPTGTGEGDRDRKPVGDGERLGPSFAHRSSWSRFSRSRRAACRLFIS